MSGKIAFLSLQTSVFWLHFRSRFLSVICVPRILIAPEGPEIGPLCFKPDATCLGHVASDSFLKFSIAHVN